MSDTKPHAAFERSCAVGGLEGVARSVPPIAATKQGVFHHVEYRLKLGVCVNALRGAAKCELSECLDESERMKKALRRGLVRGFMNTINGLNDNSSVLLD